MKQIAAILSPLLHYHALGLLIASSAYITAVEIDEDVADEYWREIRGAPHRAGERQLQNAGKHGR